MTPLSEDEIVERIYRAHGNQPTPQLRPVLRRIWAAGLSIVEADALNAADRDALAATLADVEAHRDRALNGLVEMGKQLTDADSDRDALAATLATLRAEIASYEDPADPYDAQRIVAFTVALLSDTPDTDPEPQPGDGPDYHADHTAWKARQVRGRAGRSDYLLSDTPDTETPLHDVTPDVTLEEAKQRLADWSDSQNEASGRS